MNRARTRQTDLATWTNGTLGGTSLPIASRRPLGYSGTCDKSTGGSGDSLWELSEGGNALIPRNNVAKVVIGNVTIDGSGAGGSIKITFGAATITITPSAIAMNGGGSVSISIQSGKDIEFVATDMCENNTAVSRLVLREP